MPAAVVVPSDRAGAAGVSGPLRRFTPLGRRYRSAPACRMYDDELTREIDEGPGGPADRRLLRPRPHVDRGLLGVAFVRDGLAERAHRPGAILASTLLAAARFQIGQVGFSGFVGGTAPHAERHAREASSRRSASASSRSSWRRRSIPRRARSCTRTGAAGTRSRSCRRRRATRSSRSRATSASSTSSARSSRSTRRALHRRASCTPTCYGEGKPIAARDARRRARGRSRARATSTPTATRTCRCSRSSAAAADQPEPQARRPSPARRGWPARRFTAAACPASTDVVRTSLAIAQPRAVVPARRAGGAARAAAGGSAINLAATTWGELGHRARGIDVHGARARSTSGRTGRRSSSSTTRARVDVLLLCKLLRRDFVGIGKQELRRNPIFGPSSRSPARSSSIASTTRRRSRRCSPAVDALRHGLSIAIAPEGTRSTTPRLGPVQEGRVPHGDGGRRADRADRVPQRARRAAEARHRRAPDDRSRSSCTRRSRPRDWKRDRRSTGTSPRRAAVHRDAAHRLGLTGPRTASPAARRRWRGQRAASRRDERSGRLFR